MQTQNICRDDAQMLSPMSHPPLPVPHPRSSTRYRPHPPQEPMPEHTQNKTLKIKQQNCKHSKDITLTLLNTADPMKWDIILIQEPYIYPRTRLSPASPNWYIL